MNSYGVEKGTTIRQPSTANLMIDSQDGIKESTGLVRKNPWDFLIYKSQAIQNGFFSRIATSEVVLEWNMPNINADLSNNVLDYIDASGAPGVIVLNPAFYTVEQLLDRLVTEFGVDGITMAVNYNPANLNDYPCNILFNQNITFLPTPLAYMLGLAVNTPKDRYFLLNVDLRPYRYIDFVSPDLTYAQDLKDTATNSVERDVLCRWYFTYDNATPQIDAYGFPILMGYTPFFIRRLYNPPKQIKWDRDLPIGSLRFSVYGVTPVPFSDYNNEIVVLPSYDAKSNWLMTLQLSEN